VVADEYVDNDISGYSGRWRPEYERMLGDIAGGLVDRVLVWHLDRLTRRPIELERAIEVCTVAGVDITTVTGDVGLGNDAGLLVARIISAVAAAESGRKSARLRRAMQQHAEMGKPNGGAYRPFGYEPDKVTVRESEARVIRQLAIRYIAGESLNSLVRWMNKRRIPTVGRATAWQVQTLRPILPSGRIAGIREYRGRPAGAAIWPAIISARQHERVLAAYEARRRPPQWSPQPHLLAGILRCGRCGTTLVSTARNEVRRYSCPTAHGRGGCGKLSINSFHIEDWVAAAVLVRLDSPEMAELLTNRAQTDPRNVALVTELVRAQEASTRLAEMLGAWELSRIELTRAREAADARCAVALRQLDRVTGMHALDDLDDRVARTAWWARLPLDQQQALVRAVLEFAVIQPRPRGIRKLDPTRVEPVWLSA
jgi:DNA invertase Pin-like site-specific DNA recombinase